MLQRLPPSTGCEFLRPRPVPQSEYLNLVHEKFEQRKIGLKVGPPKGYLQRGPKLANCYVSQKLLPLDSACNIFQSCCAFFISNSVRFLHVYRCF